METEDTSAPPGICDSVGECGSGNKELQESNFEPGGHESQPDTNGTEEGAVDKEQLGISEGNLAVIGCSVVGEDLQLNRGDVRIEEGTTGPENFGFRVSDTVAGESSPKVNSVINQTDHGTEDGEILVDTEVDMDLVDSPVREVHIEVAGSAIVEESLNSLSSGMNGDNDCLLPQNESNIPDNKLNGCNVSGVKRPRWSYVEEQASVHITYNSLTRASKRKLEELLKKWSEWHSQHGSSTQEVNEVLESGEETYFPALCVGMDKPSAVSFWIENQTRKQLTNGDSPLDGNAVPLYDRGYALGLISADGPSNVEGGLEIVDDAARCFNCGSYNHSLKECPKPRDNAAVVNARKRHKSKRNQNSGSRNSARYYQNSSGGKYDGLKPGSLTAETRQVLGLGELDPPPWLNRMRELGYPPGYLDPDDEDEPSGITIFADGDTKSEQEDGEIVETDDREPRRKMTIEFPGINAPVPENADERRWQVGSANFDPLMNQSHRRWNHSSESITRRHYHEQRHFRGFADDGPPGVDLLFSPPSSSYPPRYGNYDSSYSSEISKGFSRSHSERGRWSTSAYEDYSSHGSPSFHSLDRRSSPKDTGSARFVHETDDRWEGYSPDTSFRSNDTYDRDRHRHRRW